MAKIIIGIIIALLGVYVGLSGLSKAGLISGNMFADQAEVVRAEAELKRVDVEMLKAQSDHLVRMALIEKATEPRTPTLIIFCLLALCLIVGALLVTIMRYREQMRFTEYQMQITGRNHKALPEPSVGHDRLFCDSRDIERGGIHHV